MSAFLQQLPLAVILVLLKSSLVVLVARFATARLHAAPAHTRHMLWVATLLAMIAIPVVAFGPWSLTVGVRLPEPWDRVMAAAGAPTVGEAIDDGRATVSPPGAGAGAHTASTLDGAMPSGAAPPPSVRTDAAPSYGHLGFSTALALLYLLGAGAVLAHALLGRAQAVALVRSARPVHLHPKWERAVEELACTPHQVARLRVTTRLGTPVTVGLWRPVVLLPEDMASWPRDLQRGALVHELAHVTRRDGLTQALAVLACAFHWFNPWVWSAARRLHLEAERACDEQVVRSGSDPRDYAQHLVDLTRHGRARLFAAVAMAGRSELSHRVTSILESRRKPMRRNDMLALASVALVVAVAVASAPVTVTRAAKSWYEQDARGMRGREAPTPLMRAAARGDLEEVRRLIADGVDVDEGRRGEGTPLILAAHDGHVEVARALVAAGADVNRIEGAGWRGDLLRSPLASAARAGAREIVELLLDHGARVDAAPEGDATALMEAAEYGHRDIARLLVDRGADVDRRIDGDGTPLIAAARGGDLAIVRMLVERGAQVNRGVPGDGNALIMAVRNEDLRMVEFLLENGADPNAFVPGDESALITAAESGSTDLMRLMLEARERR